MYAVGRINIWLREHSTSGQFFIADTEDIEKYNYIQKVKYSGII